MFSVVTMIFFFRFMGKETSSEDLARRPKFLSVCEVGMGREPAGGDRLANRECRSSGLLTATS